MSRKKKQHFVSSCPATENCVRATETLYEKKSDFDSILVAKRQEEIIVGIGS